jgi:hypothetical protein
MALHLTKIAYGAKSLEEVQSWFDADAAEMRLTTRYLPTRHAELQGGSLYWIFDHALIGRSPILRFEEREDGRWWIVLERRLIPVEPRARRAHQGWRYLKEEDAPADLGAGTMEGDVLPGSLVKDLAKLGLV